MKNTILQKVVKLILIFIKYLKLYTKCCEAFNCEHNNEVYLNKINKIY